MNYVASILELAYVLLGPVVQLHNKGEVEGVMLHLCVINFLF